MFICFYKSPPPVSTALGFEKCVSPLSTCSIEVESTSHFFFLHYRYCNESRLSPFTDLRKVDKNLTEDDVNNIISILYAGHYLFFLGWKGGAE